MTSLVFEVLSGANQTAVGRAQLDHIATLSPSQPISGHVTLSFYSRASALERAKAHVLYTLVLFLLEFFRFWYKVSHRSRSMSQAANIATVDYLLRIFPILSSKDISKFSEVPVCT